MGRVRRWPEASGFLTRPGNIQASVPAELNFNFGTDFVPVTGAVDSEGVHPWLIFGRNNPAAPAPAFRPESRTAWARWPTMNCWGAVSQIKAPRTIHCGSAVAPLIDDWNRFPAFVNYYWGKLRQQPAHPTGEGEAGSLRLLARLRKKAKQVFLRILSKDQKSRIAGGSTTLHRLQ